jgi:hypothetical protein
VHVRVQGRLVECKAVTDGPDLQSGREVRVVGLVDDEVLQVVAVE